MSALRRRWLLLCHPHVDITFEGPVYLGPGFSLHAPQGGTLRIGAHSEFRRGFRAELGPHAVVEFGEGCICTHDVIFQCSTTITLGARATLGQGTFVADGNHRFRDTTLPTIHQGFDLRPIHIGEDALVLSKCTLVADVGRHSVIGANSVVVRDIPDFVLAAGAPARVIEEFAAADG